MADMVLSSVVRKLAVVAGNLVVKEGSRLSRLKQDILWIESEMRYIRSYLEDVDATNYKSKGVSDLIRNIWDLAYDVEEIIDTYFPKLASHGRRGRLGWLKSAKWILLNCKIASDFAVEIEWIKRRVEDIKNARLTYGIRERSGRDEERAWDPRRSFPHVDEVNVVGFDELIKGLVAEVLDEDLRHRVVSIVGMGGLGKTTLAKKVYNSVQHRFQCSAWIYVSQQPNVNELLQDIARQVGLEKENWEHNVEANLFGFLSRKRYVIVIDDIWDIEPWNALKNGIPANSENGSRIIITSRNKNVVDNVGVKVVQVGGQRFLHELQPLDRENSRKLFVNMIMATPENNDESSGPSQLDHIGEQILEKCGDVPLAIVVTAGLLSLKRRTISAWKAVLENMGQGEDQYSEIIALSYKDLPIKLKPCFLYFGLFPEDHKISTFELINLWAAEGFIQGSKETEVEDVGDDYLNHLIGRNLIQVVGRNFNGRVESCRIHDILHSHCIRVANEINFFNTHNNVTSHNSAVSVRRITTHGSNFGDYISLNYRTPKLRAMMYFSGEVEDVTSFGNLLGDFRFLRVLSARGNYPPIWFLQWSLPKKVGNLSHLSYLQLGFSGGSAVKLPYTISNLKNLMTLDLQDCGGLVILPNVVWNMEQLTHILLPEFCKPPSSSFRGRGFNLDRLFHPPTKVSLPNLQTLYGLPGPNLSLQADWLHKLTNLRRLKVNRMTQRIIEVLSDAANPVIHVLEASIMELPQHEKLPPNLIKLTLKYTSLQMDPMETLNKLTKLKILELAENSYSGRKMVCSGEPPGGFPQLEVLRIELLRHLEELIVEEGGMPKLKDFTISRCNPATTIPDRIRNVMTINEWEEEEELGFFASPRRRNCKLYSMKNMGSGLLS